MLRAQFDFPCLIVVCWLGLNCLALRSDGEFEVVAFLSLWYVRVVALTCSFSAFTSVSRPLDPLQPSSRQDGERGQHRGPLGTQRPPTQTPGERRPRRRHGLP